MDVSALLAFLLGQAVAGMKGKMESDGPGGEREHQFYMCNVCLED